MFVTVHVYEFIQNEINEVNFKLYTVSTIRKKTCADCFYRTLKYVFYSETDTHLFNSSSVKCYMVLNNYVMCYVC